MHALKNIYCKALQAAETATEKYAGTLKSDRPGTETRFQSLQLVSGVGNFFIAS